MLLKSNRLAVFKTGNMQVCPRLAATFLRIWQRNGLDEGSLSVLTSGDYGRLQD